MSSSLFPAPADETKWGEGSRALLDGFLAEVANTRLHVQVLALFLNDPGLCLSSESLAKRLDAPILETQNVARQLSENGALHYCPQFAFADLCSLSLPFLTPAVRLQLGLLRLALRHEPDFVWHRFETGQTPTRTASEPRGASNLRLTDEEQASC